MTSQTKTLLRRELTNRCVIQPYYAMAGVAFCTATALLAKDFSSADGQIMLKRHTGWFPINLTRTASHILWLILPSIITANLAFYFRSIFILETGLFSSFLFLFFFRKSF